MTSLSMPASGAALEFPPLYRLTQSLWANICGTRACKRPAVFYRRGPVYHASSIIGRRHFTNSRRSVIIIIIPRIMLCKLFWPRRKKRKKMSGGEYSTIRRKERKKNYQYSVLRHDFSSRTTLMISPLFSRSCTALVSTKT